MAKKKGSPYKNNASVKPTASPATEVPSGQAPLSDRELNEYLAVTQEIFNAFAGYPSSFTPMLTSDRLKEIGYTPVEIDAETLKSVLKSPTSAESSEILSSYAEWLQFGEAITKRTSEYVGNLPSFDYTFVCTNAPRDISQQDYLDDIAIVKEFLNRFDVRGELSRIHRRSVLTDAYFGIFRMDAGYNYVFQELPSAYCLITGKSSDYGFTYDFDMSWFLKQGLSIDQYPKAMKKLWRRVFGNKSISEKYDPASRLDDRKGSFSTWAQTSPLIADGGFTCFKFNSDTYVRSPFITPLFRDAINKDVVRELQNNQYIIASQKILVGLIPLLKEQKSGQVKDAVAISPSVMRDYLGFLKQGLSSAVKIAGVPFSDLKAVDYNLPDKNMYTEYSNNLAGNTGVTSRLIYSSDKMSATEVALSSEIDTMLATQVYPQYETWLSSVINSFTQKYKFRFRFEGSRFTSSRKDRLERTLKLADKGIVLPQFIASSLGMNIFELEGQMAQGATDTFKSSMYLLLNSNTTAQDDGAVGRPVSQNPADSTDRKDDRLVEEE